MRKVKEHPSQLIKNLTYFTISLKCGPLCRLMVDYGRWKPTELDVKEKMI